MIGFDSTIAVPAVRWAMVLVIVAIGGCKSTQTMSGETPAGSHRLLQRLEAASLAANDVDRAAAYFEALELADRDGNLEARRGITRILHEDSLIDILPLHHRFTANRFHAQDLLVGGELDSAAAVIVRLVPAGKTQLDAWRMVRASWYEAAGQRDLAALEFMRLMPRGGDNRVAETRRVVVDGHAVRLGENEINNRIWHNLVAVPERLQGEPPKGAVARGWWQLARAHLQARSNVEWRRQRQEWLDENPSHPAAQAPPDAWLEVAGDPRNIGLFLPLTGPLRGAAEAIRDGFVAAYMKAGNDAQGIRVYDTTQGIDNAIAWAESDGMEIIVGPLDKQNVERMAARRLDIPVIALNHPEGSRPVDCAPGVDDGFDNGRDSCPRGEFLHIALAVEDDARAIREALEERGLRHLAVFESQQHWARRSRLELEAGSVARVVAHGRFSDASMVTDTVAKVFGIERSIARAKDIRDFLGIPIEFAPRRRNDIDAIVAFIDGGDLTPLAPALAFHYADDLPLFVPGTTIREAGDFLEVRQLSVPVATWRLDPTPLETEAIESLGVSEPLLALGIDGYRLANRLGAFVRGEALLGSTGILRLGDDGQVERTLFLAEVSSGRLKVLPRRTVDGLAVDDVRPDTAAR